MKDKMIDAINEIVNAQIDKDKSKTLARQRGYLTGWLARLAAENWNVQQEIETRRNEIRKKSGAGSEDRTRN